MKFGQWYCDYVKEDVVICKFMLKGMDCVGISWVEIECMCDCVCVDIYIVWLGIVIGCCGVEVDWICGEFEKFMGKQVQLNIFEVKNFEVDVQLVVQGIVEQFVSWVLFWCVMCKGMQFLLCVGVKGIWVQCLGCFGGVEMSWLEFYCEGWVLLYMLCVNIDYGFYEVCMIFGWIGVKVWIYKGDVMSCEFVCEQVVVLCVLWCEGGCDGGLCGDCVVCLQCCCLDGLVQDVVLVVVVLVEVLVVVELISGMEV